MSGGDPISAQARAKAAANASEVGAEEQILRAIREIDFGTVEVVVHQSRITEIRQTRRTRMAGTEQNQAD